LASSVRRRRSGPPYGTILLILFLVLVAGGAAWYWLRSGGEPDPTPTLVTPEAAPGQPAAPPVESDLELPELSASDAFIRDLVARLSQHPQLAAWLANDRLVRRFVLVVVDLAGASNPAENLRFMTPGQPFTVRQAEGRLFIAPESYQRYNLLSATVASLDARGSAELYQQLRPLIYEAYAELGIPETTFDEALEMALRNIMAAPVMEEPVEVLDSDGLYILADPELEARRGAHRALLRMGPENTRRIQGKASELARELGIQP